MICRVNNINGNIYNQNLNGKSISFKGSYNSCSKDTFELSKNCPPQKTHTIGEDIKRLSPDFKKYSVYSANKDNVDTYTESGALQNNAGFETVRTTFWNTKGEEVIPKNSGGTHIVLLEKFDKNNELKSLERSEQYADGVILSWYDNGDRFFEDKRISYKFPDKTLYKMLYQLETVLDAEKDGLPVEIIYKKASSELKGVYEITKYTLSDYEESYDVVSGIKNGTIEGGEKLSYITKNGDGSITYKENLASNGYEIQRKYTVSKDKNKNSYSYKITNPNGETILNLTRSFEKISDNKTKTVINGKEYTAFFDDAAQTIILKTPCGIYSINIKPKTDTNENKEEREILWNTAKKMPADMLKALDQIPKWKLCDDKESGYYFDKQTLESGTNIVIIAHELGHSKSRKTKLCYDKNLIDIYNREIENFNNKYTTSAGQNYIQYFSQKGGGEFNTGLNEITAETNVILAVCGNNIDETITRAQFLVWNFPETIAYIAKKYGY